MTAAIVTRARMGTDWTPPDKAEVLRWLAELDRLLDVAAAAAKGRYGVSPGDNPYRGLYVGADELDQLLARAPALPLLADWAAAGFEPAVEPRLGLSPLQSAALLVALASEVDSKYERIYCYLHDDVTRRRPTVGLVLDLFCRDGDERIRGLVEFAVSSPLRSGHLIEVGDDSSRQLPLIVQPYRLDSQLTRLLLDGPDVDPRLTRGVRLLDQALDIDELQLATGTATQAAAAIRLMEVTGRLQVTGGDERVVTELATALAGQLGKPVLGVDLTAFEATDDVTYLLEREAHWHGAAVVVRLGHHSVASWERLLRRLPMVLVTRREVDLGLSAIGFPALEVPLTDLATRRTCWFGAAAALGLGLSVDDVESLARTYRLSASEIEDAAQIAAISGALAEQSAVVERASASSRALAARSMGSVARQVELSHEWDDLVLPQDTTDQLRELCSRVRFETEVLDVWGFRRASVGSRGLHALFSGPSGTGKTAAAQIVAGALGLQLWGVELSTVISKYIGETEKNLDRIFTAAKSADVVLIFDEADALFGKRSEIRDSHDRYANVEISYLLQRMEEHDGVTVLATNLRSNLDTAFLRRLAFDVRFPFPDDEQRLLIWQRVYPVQVPLGADVDFADLAVRYRLSGGQIRNVAVASAYLAASESSLVRARHVEHAIRREYQKLGQPLGADLSVRDGS